MRHAAEENPLQHSTSSRDTAASGKSHGGGLVSVKILICALIIAAIILPWILMVRHRAPEFLSRTMAEARAHAIQGKEGHHFPPGYHLVMVWPMFMPWSLLLPLAIGAGIRNRRVPEIRFALAAVLGPWLMVEFVGTKLPHYLLPAYPALAFLVASAIRPRLGRDSQDLRSVPFKIGALFWSAAVAAVALLPWLALRAYHPLPLNAMIALSALGVLYAIVVAALFLSNRFKTAFIAMGSGMLASVALACLFYFPRAQFLRTSIAVADVLRSHGAVHPGDVKMVDYKEPSLGFYQGGTIREVDKKAELIYKPLPQWPRWVVITSEAWEMVPPQTRQNLRIISELTGLAYADRGRKVRILVVEKPPQTLESAGIGSGLEAVEESQ